MRRVETYVGSQCYEWIDSVDAQSTMTAIAKVCAAMFGTTGIVNGLVCGPTSPASMTVQIGAGEIYQMAPLEATACGTLPANTAYNILKQGIQLGTYTTGTLAAPVSTGQSINYLVEVQYQDSDLSLDPTTGISPSVLQFYNASNPQVPWSGPNNTGASSNTFRDGIVAYQIKAGTAATTGSQVTPSPDTGWIGLWVVTVPYGATTLTSSNIAQYTGAPVLPTGILQSVLTSNLTYGVDVGSANTVQARFPIPVTTLTDGIDIWVKIAAANTGATTFTPNPGVISASPVVGAAHAALQGGELAVNGRANLIWRQDITSWVLIECTGAAVQISPATQSQHAMQLGQATGRLLAVRTFTSNTTYTPTTGTTTCRITLVGGGASGGGAAATSAGQMACGAGGGGGGFAVAVVSASSVSGKAITIGAGGAASSNTGNVGGTTSVGASLSAGGGSGGSVGLAVSSPAVTTGGPGGNSTGGTYGGFGGVGGNGVAFATANATSGTGGSSYLAGGVGGQISAGFGNAGVGAGCGGSGALSVNGASAQASGAGAAGIVIIEEFA